MVIHKVNMVIYCWQINRYRMEMEDMESSWQKKLDEQKAEKEVELHIVLTDYGFKLIACYFSNLL